ncbi:SDR family oxidoreductase [Streptomyces krungchingensis]
MAGLGPTDETEKLIRGVGGEVFSARCDVSEADSVAGFAAAVTERFGHVDILVHNAGIYPIVPFGVPLTNVSSAPNGTARADQSVDR